MEEKKKLYLLLDDWDNDRNFVGRELDVIYDKFDVTIVCDTAHTPPDDRFDCLIYKEPAKYHMLKGMFKALFDKDTWTEIMRAATYRSEVRSHALTRISEALRFYVKSYLYYVFLKENNCYEDGVIYYLYWNFRKCYAITHEKDKYPNSRVISRIHGYDLYDDQIPSGFQPFKPVMDRKLDKLIFVSEHGMEYYLSKYHLDKSDKYELRCLGTSDHAKTVPYIYRNEIEIVSCSRVDQIKRVGRIAEALSYINDVTVHWTHFGSGVLLEEVKKHCKELLDDKANITYELKGQVDNAAIHAFYREHQVDVFVTASSSEGNPVSVMEAMSYGIPIIAPAICNFPNMIKGCGIMVPPDCKAEDIADAIGRLANMPEKDIRQLRHDVRGKWDRSFNGDKNNNSFVELLDSL